MKTEDFEKGQGHWVLAKVGKKVLRPGGRELTEKMLDALAISADDTVAEFAPGLGYTAARTLERRPAVYTGIDAEERAVRGLQNKFRNTNARFLHGTAAATGLPEASCTKVYGEAMLTMHADHRKAEIIREAHRILKKGGLYGIHELALKPDALTDEVKADLQKNLSKEIRVNARPLTPEEWKAVLEKEGFRIKEISYSPMHLLEPKRVLQDEGLFRTLRIACNVLMQPDARKRILSMRAVFRKYQSHLNAVCIIAEKV